MQSVCSSKYFCSLGYSRKFARVIVCVAAVVGLVQPLQLAASASSPLNIILIMADDK
jgi:hypothetical protein